MYYLLVPYSEAQCVFHVAIYSMPGAVSYVIPIGPLFRSPMCLPCCNIFNVRGCVIWNTYWSFIQEPNVSSMLQYIQCQGLCHIEYLLVLYSGAQCVFHVAIYSMSGAVSYGIPIGPLFRSPMCLPCCNIFNVRGCVISNTYWSFIQEPNVSSMLQYIQCQGLCHMEYLLVTYSGW